MPFCTRFWDQPAAFRRAQFGARGRGCRCGLGGGLTSQQDVASFVAGITLASGVLFLLLAVLRMGWIAQFLSRAVVTGFLFGAAIDVVIGELPKLTGTDVSGSNSLQELWSWLGTLGQIHQVTAGRRRSPGRRLRSAADRPWRSGRPGARRRWAAGIVAAGPRRARRGAGRCRTARPALAEIPDLKLMWDHAGTAAVAAVALC